MAALMEMAKELGQAMARTDEFQALRRAITAADDDRELTELRNTMAALEGQIAAAVRAGKEPEEAVKTDYESTFTRLQANPTYQRLAVAQANFDKVLVRVNETISQGMESAAESRIIMPS